MPENPFKLTSRETAYKGFRTLEIIKGTPRSLSHDGWAKEMQREVVSRGTTAGVACILPYIPETDEVILIRQFRMGAWAAGAKDPFIIECARGFVDDGETVEEAARRETLEETGAVALEIEKIGNCYTSTSVLAEDFHLFIARVGKTTGGMHGLAHEGEEIESIVMPAEKAIALLDAGGITDAPLAVMLHWFARNHEKLKRKWSTACVSTP